MQATILIAEDDHLLSYLFQKALTHAGYRTEVAWNGHEVMTRITAITPDILLLDIGLPDVSGMQLLKNMRNYYPDMIIVVVTGNNNAMQSEESQLADLFLLKPVSVRELVTLLGRLYQNTH